MEKTRANDRIVVLERLLNDARSEADDLRKKLEHFERLVRSSRLIMGHELKKPTTAISGYLELVCEDLEEANKLSTLNYAEKAKAECDLLNELNTFYLELLKLDSEEEKVGGCPVDLDVLLHEIVQQFPSDMNASARVHLFEGRPLKVETNRNALKLIITNLIENALLYSQSQEPIEVRYKLSPDRRGMEQRELLKLSVSDSGIGIPEQYLQKIFSPFVRLREDMAEGSGLGLTLVRSLVELNGGDVFVRSSPGAGTTVHVTLPAAPMDREEGGEER